MPRRCFIVSGTVCVTGLLLRNCIQHGAKGLSFVVEEAVLPTMKIEWTYEDKILRADNFHSCGNVCRICKERTWRLAPMADSRHSRCE